jgi:transposase
VDPDVQRRGPRRADLRAHGRIGPLFAKIGAYVGELIESATQAAARAWGKTTTPEAQVATTRAQEEAGGVQRPLEERAAPLAARGVDAGLPPAAPVEPPPPVGATRPQAERPQGDAPRSWERWTTARIRTRLEKVFGLDVCQETVRRVLHRLGLSWKKGKKLLAKADPDKRRAFVTDIRALLGEVLHNESLGLAYIDEAHVHQDADMGYGWSPRGRRLFVASSAPGLKAKVTFYGVYLYSESEVRIWPYPRGNGEHTIDVLERLRAEFQQRPLIVIWDGASYHRSACVLEAAARLDIRIVRLPAYSPDFMPVEALWRWLRESVTYNHCHDTAAELIERVAAFVAEINRAACALADRLWVKDELDPEEEKLRFSS